MLCFVTGASGFIGANLVRELLARGHRVKALLPPAGDQRSLEGLEFEVVSGELSNPESSLKAMAGCDWCFHLAASYHLWLPDYRPMYETNVEGTRNIIQSAWRAGCTRIVHTSTTGCIGLPRRSHGILAPSDETAAADESEMFTHYKRSKWQAEQVATGFASRGAPVVIVNPTAPVGPWDTRPTPTGQVIVDLLNGRMPCYLNTGLNWVHVRDVAVGQILAAEKGRVGERYILGNANGNWTMRETFAALGQLTGLPMPQWRIPYWVALLFGYYDEGMARWTGRPPRAPLGGVRMARRRMFFNPAKAIRELGLPQTPVQQALADAVEWFRTHGYAVR